VAFDAFISYATPDKTVADAVCARLESAGIRCWIAPRDVTPGVPWAESIIGAIDGAKVMILVFSSNANKSPQVPREVERAVGRELPIIPFRIEDVKPAGSLDYYIKSVHWLDALNPPLERHIDSLAATVRKLVTGPMPGVAPTPQQIRWGTRPAAPPAAPAPPSAPAAAPAPARPATPQSARPAAAPPKAAPRKKSSGSWGAAGAGVAIFLFWLIRLLIEHWQK